MRRCQYFIIGLPAFLFVMSQFSSITVFFFSIRYGTLFRNQKLTRKQRLVIFSMSVHQFSESKAFMHQLTRIFCNIKVEVTALSSYEEKEELFKEQVDWTYKYSIFVSSMYPIPFSSVLDAIALVMKFSSSVQLMSSLFHFNDTEGLLVYYVIYFFLAGWTTKAEILSFNCTRWSCS